MKITTMNDHQIHHYLIFFLISCHFFIANSINNASTTSSPKCLHDQSSILLQFKEEFTVKFQQDDYSSDYGTNPKMESWNAKRDCCSWDGIKCDRTGRVIGLDLSSSSLQGPFLSNSSLFGLIYLEQLNLAYNDFNYSGISPAFGHLSRLTHLNLSLSMFSGKISNEISWLRNLVSLDLSSLEYSDNPPLFLGKEVMAGLVQNATNLRELNLDAVDLSSTEAESFGNFTSLERLSLSQCKLSGEFPKNIFHLPKIRAIDVSSNDQLTGSLPEFIPGSSLESLALSFTNFSGTLLDSIGNLKSLDTLNLASCNLSGTIPASIGNLSRLTDLDLSNNNFSGEVPSSLGSLTQLKYLLLSKNQFSGRIPSSLGNLTRLIDLQLSYNKFSGEFPISLAKLTMLDSLDLSYNQLAGLIPGDIRKFPNSMSLGSLDLSHNFFNGTIPSTLFRMPSLTILNLDYNQFTGPLTIQNVSSSQLGSLYLRRNNLNGMIPRSISKLTNLTDLYLNANKLSGRVDLGLFSELSNLATLDLSYNNLSITNTDVNSSLPKFSSLSLASCNITEFPKFLKTQSELWLLDLTNNKIEGKIPKWFLNIGTESLSTLDLSSNFITGWEQEPSVLPWNALDFFDLRRNKIRGSLIMPPPTTRYYFISNNTLTGEIDPLFCKLSNLKVLDVSNNNLSGEIPLCLGSNSSLLMLNLQRNNFHGDIPQSCNNGNSLKTLDVSHNYLRGKVPKSLTKCKELEVLNIGHNQISDEFPFWTQSLPKLQVLVLRDNKFYGPVWHQGKFFGFEKLRIIDLSFNNFDGYLPSLYFKNWSAINSEIPSVNKSKLRYMGDTDNYYQDSMTLANKGSNMLLPKILTTLMSIDLSNNNFHGEIPSSTGELKSLVVLNLSSNNFEGLIPVTLGNLRELESLDLSKNRLSGEIPQQLASLTFLAYLNLSENNLQGKIPQQGQLSTFPNSSYEGNALLCGFPLSKKCGNTNKILHHSQNSKLWNGFGWKSVLIGFGCGLAIGMIGEHALAWRRPNYLVGIYGRFIHDNQ